MAKTRIGTPPSHQGAVGKEVVIAIDGWSHFSGGKNRIGLVIASDSEHSLRYYIV
jgi:hypothetical protein